MENRFDRFFNAVKHPIVECKVQRAKGLYRKDHPACAVCGREARFFWNRNNDVHHLMPVHIAPELATDPENLITLCRLHHWLFGHLTDWKAWNTQLDQMIREFSDFINHAKLMWRRR